MRSCMRIQLDHSFGDIISVENLLEAWREFLRGKRLKHDVQEFSHHLMDNIFVLHHDLIHHTYRHGGYQAFRISDPKPRHIHKASVRDRLVHRAIYRVLYPFFDRTFIVDSYSCRLKKGTHKALNRFRSFGYRVSQNQTQTAWVLKCDIRRFFESIDHEVLRAATKHRMMRRIRENPMQETLNSYIGLLSHGNTHRIQGCVLADYHLARDWV